MYEFIKYESASGVVTITINRPDVYNALNDEAKMELLSAFKQVKKDKEARVVVLTGEGKAFCSGQDLKDRSGNDDFSFKKSLEKMYNPLIKAIRKLPLPVICKMNGVAAGAGCSLVLACDLTVANEEAQLIEVFINIGLVPDSGSSYFLPRAIGSARAFEMATMGTRVSGKQAAEWGLVNKAVPADKLDETVSTYVDYFSKAPTKAIGLIKKMFNKSGQLSLKEMLEYEAYCQEIAGSSEDFKEGVSAFLEKRKPEFVGK